MATTLEQPAAKTTAVAKQAETTISYVPLGEVEPIHLTVARVKNMLCTPTKSGAMPTDTQVVKFMMLCKAQSLNPWVNDAYLVGYDSKDGPQFSLITAHQSLLKRAEASPEFDGMESGVIVLRDEQVTERQGDLILKGETLVGAWARVHRRDRKVPSYDAINLSTFDTGRSRWAADKGGMIVKCAEASALRKAFPSTLAAMYCKEEMDRERESRDGVPHIDARPKADRLADRLIGVNTESPVSAPDVAPSATPEASTSHATTDDTRGAVTNDKLFSELMAEVHKADDNDKLNAATRLVQQAFAQDRISQDQCDDLLATIQEVRELE